MMIFELFVQKGVLNQEQRRRLSERLVAEFMTEEEMQGAPAGVIQDSLALQHVLVQEVDTWAVAGRHIGLEAPPQYFVRVSVPGDWRKIMSAEVISRVTRVLASADDKPDRLFLEPAVWVHVIGVPEDSFGTFGQPMKSTDLVRMMTRSFRESPERDALVQSAAPGTLVDPICGMTVQLEDNPLTLEHDGITYGFCSPGCRRAFLEELRAHSHE